MPQTKFTNLLLGIKFKNILFNTKYCITDSRCIFTKTKILQNSK